MAGGDIGRLACTRGRIRAQQTLSLQVRPEGGRDVELEVRQVVANVRDLIGSGNDGGDDRMMDRELECRGLQRNMMRLAQLLD